MIFPAVIREALQQTYELIVEHFTPASGGCINHGGTLATQSGLFFIKWNDASKFPGMFDAEAKGLKLLTSQNCVRVPSVVGVGSAGAYQYILLEHVTPTRPSSTFWQDLGRSLATLHHAKASTFGLDHNNYIGSLPQINNQMNNWIDFLITQRLEPQLTILNASGNTRKKFEKLYTRLPEMFPVEPPSLLHGDLWNGNLIRDDRGNPCLIDPAVYFGHREMDIAFTYLFGGFNQTFYDTYKEVYPLEPGHSDRIDVCNLYPLLVHANLFGGHYLMEIQEIVSRWA